LVSWALAHVAGAHPDQLADRAEIATNLGVCLFSTVIMVWNLLHGGGIVINLGLLLQSSLAARVAPLSSV